MLRPLPVDHRQPRCRGRVVDGGGRSGAHAAPPPVARLPLGHVRARAGPTLRARAPVPLSSERGVCPSQTKSERSLRIATTVTAAATTQPLNQDGVCNTSISAERGITPTVTVGIE